jgi:hypothetical protein
MAADFEPNTLGYILSTIVGALCGLIPRKFANERDMSTLGVICVILCAVVGFKGGLIIALPVAGILALLLYLFKAKKSDSQETDEEQ